MRSMKYLERRILFDGMEYLLNGRTNVPMMDVDAIMDCHGKAWIVYECKYGDSTPPYGQRIAIERMVDDFSNGGRPGVALICSHDEGEQIYLCDCIVTSYYTTGYGWRRYGEHFPCKLTAKDFTDMYLRKYAPEMLIKKGGSL